MRQEGSTKLDSRGVSRYVGELSIEGSNVICASQSASRLFTKSEEGEEKLNFRYIITKKVFKRT